MKNNFKKILYTEDQLTNRIIELSKELNEYYKSKSDICVVQILEGSVVFAGILLTKLNFNLTLTSTKISSYGKNKFPEKIPQTKFYVDKNFIENKNILVLDDMVDKGETLKTFKKYLEENGAKEIKICVMFKKRVRSQSIKVDWYGYSIPNEWVAGFGIDSQEQWRNLPFLGIVKNKKNR